MVYIFLGVVFGVFARWGRFCLLRGLRQATGLDSSEGRGKAPALQAFALALAVALLASQDCSCLGVVDLTQAQIVRPNFSALGVFIGGAVFALGMVLANACGARSLVLLAGGNLRSLVTRGVSGAGCAGQLHRRAGAAAPVVPRACAHRAGAQHAHPAITSK